MFAHNHPESFVHRYEPKIPYRHDQLYKYNKYTRPFVTYSFRAIKNQQNEEFNRLKDPKFYSRSLCKLSWSLVSQSLSLDFLLILSQARSVQGEGLIVIPIPYTVCRTLLTWILKSLFHPSKQTDTAKGKHENSGGNSLRYTDWCPIARAISLFPDAL